MVEKKYYNVTEVAHYLGLKPLTIRKWARLGILPSTKLNGALRFNISEVEGWAKSKDKQAL